MLSKKEMTTLKENEEDIQSTFEAIQDIDNFQIVQKDIDTQCPDKFSNQNTPIQNTTSFNLEQQQQLSMHILPKFQNTFNQSRSQTRQPSKQSMQKSRSEFLKTSVQKVNYVDIGYRQYQQSFQKPSVRQIREGEEKQSGLKRSQIYSELQKKRSITPQQFRYGQSKELDRQMTERILNPKNLESFISKSDQKNSEKNNNTNTDNNSPLKQSVCMSKVQLSEEAYKRETSKYYNVLRQQLQSKLEDRYPDRGSGTKFKDAFNSTCKQPFKDLKNDKQFKEIMNEYNQRRTYRTLLQNGVQYQFFDKSFTSFNISPKKLRSITQDQQQQQQTQFISPLDKYQSDVMDPEKNYRNYKNYVLEKKVQDESVNRQNQRKSQYKEFEQQRMKRSVSHSTFKIRNSHKKLQVKKDLKQEQIKQNQKLNSIDKILKSDINKNQNSEQIIRQQLRVYDKISKSKNNKHQNLEMIYRSKNFHNLNNLLGNIDIRQEMIDKNNE